MSVEIGIVGLPNVGKSTLFNALTGRGADVQNFPFTTIEPNVGVVPLRDERLNQVARLYGSAKVTPAGIRFVDIAGLVKGASQGEGLGNQFLGHIRAVDAIAHVVRCFQDEDVVNVIGDLDPLHAISIVETELLLADLEQAERALERIRKPAQSGDKQAQVKLEMLEPLAKGFAQGKPARSQPLSAEADKEFQFLSAKPVVYIANMDEKGLDERVVRVLKEKADQDRAGLITICAKLEAEILELPEEERPEYYTSAGITTPGLDRLAQAGKEILNLICFYTANPNEARAWLIPKGTRAVKAAGKIHTDMEQGFIRAEVIQYNDLMVCGSTKAVQEKGLAAIEGKDYPVRDGDIIYFRFHQ